MKAPRQNRRLVTEQKLVESVGIVLAEKGVDQLGVNALAKAAGVNKALIYRYFGSLEGLLRAYGESADFWPTLDEVMGPDRDALQSGDIAVATRILLERYATALRSRPITLQLLAWECVQRTPLTETLECAREAWSDRLFAEVLASGLPVTPDVLVYIATTVAGINYLAVRSRDIRIFSAVDVQSDDGWAAIAETIERAVRGLVSQQEPDRGSPARAD